MRAIVLSGGGANGSYEIGVWKALRKLNITYDIVTGTSVGALNGALMVQNDYLKGLFLWYNIKYNDVFKYDKSKSEIASFYKKNIFKGGVDVTNLEKTMKKCINIKKFFSSKVNFGLVTVKVPSLKHVEITKKDLNEHNLVDYLIASASCFPAFKLKKIDGKSYIDGGFYDNLPINLAISLGADEVIAVDLDQIGIKRHVKYDAKITFITPRNDIGSFLKFDKISARRGMRLGYNDTMKCYKKLDGDKYTFKRNNLKNNYKKIKNAFIKQLDSIFDDTIDDVILKKILIKKLGNDIENINIYIEKLGYMYLLDDSYIYEINRYNNLLLNKLKKTKVDYDLVHDKIKLKNLFDNEILVKFLYELLEKKDYTKIKKYILMFSNEVIMAIYLKVIK